MRKLSLDMNALTVESFEMADGDTDGRGTIRANAATLICSIAQSCIDTCAHSCGGSCLTGMPCNQVC